jgi:hypothetical protein
MTLIEAVTALEILAENMDVRDQLLNEARIWGCYWNWSYSNTLKFPSYVQVFDIRH